jgi:hypothetical protein
MTADPALSVEIPLPRPKTAYRSGSESGNPIKRPDFNPINCPDAADIDPVYEMRGGGVLELPPDDGYA